MKSKKKTTEELMYEEAVRKAFDEEFVNYTKFAEAVLKFGEVPREVEKVETALGLFGRFLLCGIRSPDLLKAAEKWIELAGEDTELTMEQFKAVYNEYFFDFKEDEDNANVD